MTFTKMILIALVPMSFCEGSRRAIQHERGFSYTKDMLSIHLYGYRGAFCKSKKCPETSTDFPGSNVTNIFRYDAVVKEMKQSAEKQRKGDHFKGNDLGYLILNKDFWKGDGAYETISLGISNDMHAFIRPILDATVGSQGQQTWKWSREKFLESARDFWSNKPSIFTKSLEAAKWTTRIMHKHHLNLELSEDEVADFVSFQGSAKKGVVMPIGQSFVLPRADVRKRWLMKYMGAIQDDTRGVFPDQEQLKEVQLRDADGHFKIHDEMNFDCEATWETPPCKLHMIAAAMMDSMLFAGGLSVRTALEVGMNLLYSTHFKNEYYDGIDEFRPVGGGIEKVDVEAFVYELFRIFPGVVGFPWWSKGYNANEKDGSTFTRRTIMNIAMALRDEDKFSRPDRFSVKRAEQMGNMDKLKDAMSVAWAGPANHDTTEIGGQPKGTMARGCPGKSMSVDMVSAFFEAFSEVCQDFVVAYVGKEGKGGITMIDRTPFVDTGATLHKVIKQGELEMKGKKVYAYLEPPTSNGPAKFRVYSSKEHRKRDHPDDAAEVWDLEKSKKRCFEVDQNVNNSKCFIINGIVPWGPFKGTVYNSWPFCSKEDDTWFGKISPLLQNICD